MQKQNRSKYSLSTQEIQLLERLRKRPTLKTQLESILEIVAQEEGSLKSADEIESLLIQELRTLGNLAMTQWARDAEGQLGQDLKTSDPSVRARKKKRSSGGAPSV